MEMTKGCHRPARPRGCGGPAWHPASTSVPRQRVRIAAFQNVPGSKSCRREGRRKPWLRDFTDRAPVTPGGRGLFSKGGSFIGDRRVRERRPKTRPVPFRLPGRPAPPGSGSSRRAQPHPRHPGGFPSRSLCRAVSSGPRASVPSWGPVWGSQCPGGAALVCGPTLCHLPGKAWVGRGGVVGEGMEPEGTVGTRNAEESARRGGLVLEQRPGRRWHQGFPREGLLQLGWFILALLLSRVVAALGDTQKGGLPGGSVPVR